MKEQQNNKKELADQKECLIVLATWGQGTRTEIAHTHARFLMKRMENTPIKTQTIRLIVDKLKEKFQSSMPALIGNGLVELVEIRECSITEKQCQVIRCTPIGLSAAIECEND